MEKLKIKDRFWQILQIVIADMHIQILKILQETDVIGS